MANILFLHPLQSSSHYFDKIPSMILIRKILTLAIILVALPLSMTAQPSSEIDTIDDILKHLSLEEQLAESPKDLYQQFSQNPFGLPPAQNEQMMDIFLDTFTADSLSDYIHQTFVANMDKNHAQSVAKWFNQDKNQPLLNAEKEYYTIEGIRKRVVNRYEMEQDPPSAERKQLLSTLAQSKSAAETELETQVILFRSLVKAFGILSSQRDLSNAQIEGFVNNFRSQAQMQIDRETTQKLMLQFYGIDNELINNYNSFYESEGGQWLSNTKSAALKSAYQKASNNFLESIKNL